VCSNLLRVYPQALSTDSYLYMMTHVCWLFEMKPTPRLPVIVYMFSQQSHLCQSDSLSFKA